MRFCTILATAALLFGAVAPAAEPAPQKASLAFPVLGKGAAAKAPSVRCAVEYGPTTPVAAVAFRPDGKMLASAGYGEVLLWDLAGAKLAERLAAGEPGDVVGAVAFLPDGKSLAVGVGTPHKDGAVKIFNVESGAVAATAAEPKEVVYCLEVSPDGKLLAGGGADGKAHVWNTADWKLLKTIDDHSGWVLDVSFSPDGKLLATAGTDRAAIVWKIEDWSRAATLEEDETVHGVAFGGDNTLVVLAVGGPSGWRVQERRTNNVRSKRSLWYRGGMPLDLVWVNQGNKAVVPLADNNVLVFANRRLSATLSGHTDWVHAVAVDAEGKIAASGSADGTVRLWNLADGKPLATLVQLTPRSDEWLVTTELGYVATSSPGALKWETANVETPPEQLAGVFTKPESVGQVLAGEKVEPPALP